MATTMPSKKAPNLFDPTPWLAHSVPESTTASSSTSSPTVASAPSLRALPQTKVLTNAIKTSTRTTTTKTSTYHLGSLIKTKEVTKAKTTEYFQPELFSPPKVNNSPGVAAENGPNNFRHTEQFAEPFAKAEVTVENCPLTSGTSTTMSLEHSNGFDDDVSVELPSPYSGDEESEVSSRHRSFNVTVDHVVMSDDHTPRPRAPRAPPPRSPLAEVVQLVDIANSSSRSGTSCPKVVVPKPSKSEESAASKTGELVDTTMSNASIAGTPGTPERALHELAETSGSPDPRSDYYAHHPLDSEVSQSAELLSTTHHSSGSSATGSAFDFRNFHNTALRELEETLSATGAIEESSLSVSAASSPNFHRGEESALRDIVGNTPDVDTSYRPYGENSSATFLGSPPDIFGYHPDSNLGSEDASGGGCSIGYSDDIPREVLAGVQEMLVATPPRTMSAAEVELESAGVSLRERVRDLLDNIAQQVSGSVTVTGTPRPPSTTPDDGSPPRGREKD